jgi:chromobox protein 1
MRLNGLDTQPATTLLSRSRTSYRQSSEKAAIPREVMLTFISDAREVVAKYHDKIGGDPAHKGPKQAKSTPNTKRSASSSQSTPKRIKKEEADPVELGSWLPNKVDWEADVEEVTHIERDAETDQLVVFVHWKNGRKTKVSMSQVYRHCPRPMLRFYEKHL